MNEAPRTHLVNPLSYFCCSEAEISRQDSQLYSLQFDDIYHHRQAIEESKYVFHQGNQLIRCWQEKSTEATFTVAETGFGTGLNFLTTRRLWRQTKHKPKHLHYITTEQWLPSSKHISKAYSEYPELKQDAEKILPVFSIKRPGFHSMQLDDDITLHILIGDACECLKQLSATVDAWFLDGFSPAKNPSMWSRDLCLQMARLSQPGTRFATFTAASSVRKNLQSVGFEVEKTPGFQGKRERLIGRFRAAVKQPQNELNWAPFPKANNQSRRITIIGAGIAGLCLAKSAKENGMTVTLIDQMSRPFMAASGNAYALIMPYLTAQSSPEALFYWRAFEHACNSYPAHVFSPIGVKENNSSFSEGDGRLELPCDLVQQLNVNVSYPTAGFIDTGKLAAELASNVDQWVTAHVSNVQQTDRGEWALFDAQQNLIDCSELMVVAAGIQSAALLPQIEPHLNARQGQTDVFKLTEWPEQLTQAQLDKSYLIPVKEQQHILIGGNYQHLDKNDWFKIPKPSVDTQHQKHTFWQNKPGLKALKSAQWLSSHAGIRANSKDHLPLCGPLVNTEQFKTDYKDLHHGRHWQQYPPAKTHDNAYVLTGLGSRGFTSAPLLADYLMAMILDQPLPLERDLSKIIHPNRFLHRQLKKPPSQPSEHKS